MERVNGCRECGWQALLKVHHGQSIRIVLCVCLVKSVSSVYVWGGMVEWRWGSVAHRNLNCLYVVTACGWGTLLKAHIVQWQAPNLSIHSAKSVMRFNHPNLFHVSSVLLNSKWDERTMLKEPLYNANSPKNKSIIESASLIWMKDFTKSAYSTHRNSTVKYSFRNVLHQYDSTCIAKVHCIRWTHCTVKGGI